MTLTSPDNRRHIKIFKELESEKWICEKNIAVVHDDFCLRFIVCIECRRGQSGAKFVAGTGCTVTGNTAFFNGVAATGTVYGINLIGYNLVDQNTAYNNNGTNMTLGVLSCIYGNNVAP